MLDVRALSAAYGQHPALQQMPVLGVDDGFEQVNGPARPEGQAAAAELDPRLHQALVFENLLKSK